MTLSPKIYEAVRLEFYSSKLFSGQDIRGGKHIYSDLVETFQIAILGSNKIFNDEILVHTFEYYDKVHKVSLKGRSKIIIVELPKVIEKPTEEMKTSERWSYFLQHLTNKKKRGKINEILKEEEEIAMAGKTLVNITQGEIEFARQTTELKNILDYQSGMASAKKRGLAEGMEKGHTEEKLKIAKKLLDEGSTPEFVQKITGLSSESIKELLD